MANRRMFALSVTDSDEFQSMPLSTQAIYFHLAMHADDDGFVGSPKRILKGLGGGDDELRLLVAKGYIIPFNTGLCVIKHWKIHNLIKNDRYHKTIYADEKKTLALDDANRYVEVGTKSEPSCNQVGSQVEPQARLGKDSQGKYSQEPDEDEQASCIRYYQDNGITLSFRHYDEIGDFLIDGVSGELVRYAADVSIENAAKSWKYAKTIITKWRDNGVCTVDAARLEQAAFRAKKNAPTSQPMYSPMMTRVEELLNDD